jgi:hypothetical protein
MTTTTTDEYTYLSLPNYGTLCRYKVRDEVWERLEAHCLNCGYHPEEHNCGAIDCEDYDAAPFTEGFEKIEGKYGWTGEVIHTETKKNIQLLSWTDEECDDWLDNHDDQENCLYLHKKLKKTTFTYEYDDCGVLCRHNDRDGDWEVLEPHCLNCGYPDDNHDDNDCDWEDAPYIQDDTPASQRKWYKGEEERDELNAAIDASGNCF